MTNDKSDIMKKLKGLLPHQERVHYVKFGHGYSNSKIYFRTAKEAIEIYQALGNTAPASVESETLHAFQYKAIEKQLEGKNLTFAYINDKITVELGSEVIDAYDSKDEMLKAKNDKHKQLTEMNEKAEKGEDVAKETSKLESEEDNIPF